ncbi:MAG: ABC transporter ATP-binding protein [Mobiluncus sp.]|uniref:ABC transporter ATP-binding protein n=1 Tax=Mobiluncus sp. TaxID=47293 RepID=UPI00258E28FA|nr:ABC transporter ATP-binding protein [Mobiluncus sp.]MCI6584122.1 ABC transporter ATP-binding protein [Mobiluncus sp.]
MGHETYTKPLVKVDSLTKTYGGGRSVRTALNSLTLDLEPGKIIGLLGENGSGKTTLLKILAGVLTPSAGTATIAGEKPSLKTKSLTSFQPDASVLPNSIKGENAIKMYADFFPDFDAAKAHELLEFLGLETSLKTSEMSKGMREKLQLALAMSRHAKLYLLDEPISGVDPASREALLQTILKGWNPEATLLISTHLVTDIETVLDEVIYLHQGRLFRHAEADELREEYGLSLDQIFRKEYSNVR